MKIEGYCEGCPIVTSIERAIRTDNPEQSEELIVAKTEDMIRNYGEHLLMMCDLKDMYGVVDLRQNSACKRITNKDGNMV